jgi:hypothetical protein
MGIVLSGQRAREAGGIELAADKDVKSIDKT